MGKSVRHSGCFVRAVVLLLPLAAIGYSQSTTSLRGVVTDVQAGVIPGTVITLTDSEKGTVRQVVTDAVGQYAFLQMPPGTYTLKAEKPGFSTATRANIRLLVNTPASLDLQLAIGNATETVNVTADAAATNTVDASVGNPFSERQLRQLPLETRNVVELLSLQPGVTPTGEVMGARQIKTTSR